MRGVVGILLVAFLVLVGVPPAAAAPEIACPETLSTVGETWTRGSTTVTLDSGPNYRTQKCAYSGASGSASFAMWWQPATRPDFFGQQADVACLQPGASERDLTYAAGVEARVLHNSAYGSTPHLQGIGQQLLALVAPLAQPCPAVPCPTAFDFGAGSVNLTGSAGPRNASSSVFGAGHAREHGCSYSTTLPGGRILLVSVVASWVNETHRGPWHWACNRTLDPHPLSRRSFDESLQLGVEITLDADVATTNASAEALGRDVLSRVKAENVARDAVPCPARAPPASTPATPPSAPSPPAPNATLPICPARYVVGSGPATALVASRWSNDSVRGLAGALCEYALPPDETAADLVSAGKIAFVADYRIAPGVPRFGCTYAADVRTSVASATHQASIRWDERMAMWGNATRFASSSMLPLVERFALPCSPEDLAAAAAAPCPPRLAVTFSASEVDPMRLLSQQPVAKDPATGWWGLGCSYAQSGETRLSFHFGFTTSWAPANATSLPHWACAPDAPPPGAGARSFPADGGRAMGTNYSDPGTFLRIFPEVQALIFQMHHALADKAAPCAPAPGLAAGGPSGGAATTPGVTPAGVVGAGALASLALARSRCRRRTQHGVS